MIRLNLLPHRELKRQAAQRRFVVLSGIGLAGVLAVAVSVHLVLAAMISNQQARNTYLKGQITILDGQISQIKTLKDKKNALLARKQIIENLVRNRTLSVHVLDQVTRLTPAGVTLKSLRQNAATLTFEGYADSNEKVADFMRNLQTSAWLTNPTLTETRANKEHKNLIEFVLDVKVPLMQTPATGPGGAR